MTLAIRPLLLTCGFLLLFQSASAADEFGDGKFGDAVHGLQCRLIPVPTTTDDQSPDATNAVKQFPTGDEVTFAVELKNVSEAPIVLRGIRYGDGYGAAKGRLNTNFLGPQLFDFQFSDGDGKPLSRAKRVYASDIMRLTGASEHELAPEESLIVVLRPAKFQKPMQHVLPAGQYQATVRYHFQKPDPDKPGTKPTKAWAHEVTSNRVAFVVTENSISLARHELVWGPEKDGLQAAMELTQPDYVAEDPFTAPGVPVKAGLGVTFHVKNVSQKQITFVSETSRQDDRVHVTAANGKVIRPSGAFFSGWPVDVRWVLDPGDVAKLQVLSSAINSLTEPGEYKFRYTVRFNGRIMKDGDGNQVFPAKGDWQDVLDTGELPLFLRKRTIEDDDRAKPPNFVGKIKFVGPDGEVIEKGSFTYRGRIKNKYHENRLIKPGTIQIPDCTANPATITVRAPGYQEARFQYVDLSENKVKTLTLQKAKPARFQLTLDDGTPVAGAKVRYFNSSFAKTSSSGVPMDGIKGPIWAESDQEGRVSLTTLQVRDEKRDELGDKLYYFYVEPSQSDLAGMFVGPIKSAQNMGVYKLGPLLNVQGEVHGTAEQLDRFAAEWDQPFLHTNDNPDYKYLYAVSTRLKTQRVGNKLTFQLNGLRAGTLRIISNFGPRPHKTKRTYGRRDAGETDVVTSVELNDETTKVIIKPK